MTQHDMTLPNPDATCAFARSLGAVLATGDTILLSGDLGTGKTHLARCLIQSLLAIPEDVPSPTFTLVQEYETRTGALWHADLYRLHSPMECEELGLLDAFETAICLIEWPDRLHDLRPENALDITLEMGTADDTRLARLTWSDPRWDARLGIVLQ